MRYLDDNVDWSACPRWIPEWETGEYPRRLKAIKFMLDEPVNQPTAYQITEAWKFVDAYSLTSARFCHDGYDVEIAPWFKEGRGPHLHAMDVRGRKMDALLRQAEIEMNEAKAIASITTFVEIVSIDSRVKRQREEALIKARSAQTPLKARRRCIEWAPAVKKNE